ncbi:MAG TPA: hypothetical protein VJ867_16045 [Gemmatimonadaceae bacterium]|nr:hypothetical protein [Gemmatimonadaceae bacterium]
MMTGPNPTARRAAMFRGLARTAGLAALVVACSTDQILDVQDIDVARPGSITGAAALPAALNGAIGTFGSAYDGANTDVNQISLSGMISDEFINTETFPTRIEIDQRNQNYQTNGSLSGLFYETQRARQSADFAAQGYAQFDATNVGFAEALNISALTIIMMAENYCGDVPLSGTDASGAFVYSPGLTTKQLLDVAIRKADSAFTIASAVNANGTQTRLARLVKARALLDENDPVAAAAAIGGTAGVPTTFQYNYIHSETSGRQNNGTWSLVQNSGRYGVANNEGGVGLPFQPDGDISKSVKDPRVINQLRPTNGGKGFDGSTTMYWQLKYPVRSAPVIVADGVEARLIEAEAQLRQNNYAGMRAILVALNSDATVAALPGRAFTTPVPAPANLTGGTTAQQEDQLFKERAYWLYLTSHRLGDLRRLARPVTAPAGELSGYGRPINSVFPNGTYFKAGTYGTDVSSPIPQAEDNNPNFDRSTCDLTKP